MNSNDLVDVRATLWKAADELRANSSLTPADARGPILGLIFLAYAEHRFEAVRPELEAKATTRRPVTPDDYRAQSVLFISEEARLSYLVNLPEQEDLGEALDTAMRLVETHNPELKGVLQRAALGHVPVTRTRARIIRPGLCRRTRFRRTQPSDGERSRMADETENAEIVGRARRVTSAALRPGTSSGPVPGQRTVAAGSNLAGPSYLIWVALNHRRVSQHMTRPTNCPRELGTRTR